ncbi:TPA: type I toxin-antitoxin system Ibs family toxin [Escherichia coli]|nr:type I toxin-antitoxin system Ibs family toxin [Escherichia coli]
MTRLAIILIVLLLISFPAY